MSLGLGVTNANGSGIGGEYGRYEFTLKLFDCWMPPTPPMEFRWTAELPCAIETFVPFELLKPSQSGASTAALPLNFRPHFVPVSVASMHGSPPAGMLAAVEVAIMVGAVLRKNELKDSGCWIATLTWTWF